jgi:fumarate hydratase subunit beta
MNEGMKMRKINTPISQDIIDSLCVGDKICLSGYIFCGRDAVLPKLVKMGKEAVSEKLGIDLTGSVIFHTAVSPAGVGPTSSNKLEIESSIGPLASMGVKIHLGKGAIRQETIDTLNTYHSVFAVIPPVTALLKSKTLEQKVIAFEEEGMEAFHMLKVCEIPAIIAAAHGKSIYF